MGSASELEYHLLLARNLSLFDETTYVKLTEETIEVKKMLTSLIQRLRKAASP